VLSQLVAEALGNTSCKVSHKIFALSKFYRDCSISQRRWWICIWWRSIYYPVQQYVEDYRGGWGGHLRFMLQVYIDCYTKQAAHTIRIRKIVSQVGFSGFQGLFSRWGWQAYRSLSTEDVSLGE
jgi:hypothetical protein